MLKQLIPPASLKRLFLATAVLAGALASANLYADAAAQASYGVCAHLTKHTDYVAEIDDIIASGVKWVRAGGSWERFETSKGVIDTTYQARVDDFVNKLTAKGVNIVWPLGFTAPWASSMPGDPNASRYKPADWADWENHVAYVTNRYKNKVLYWEVWNEQDYESFLKTAPGGNVVADYNELLQRASAIIRAASPNNKVLLGGLALYNNGADYYGPGTFLDQLLAMPGAAASFDIVNYHAYGDSVRFFKLYNAVKTSMNTYGIGSKKIWITETGYSSSATASGEVTKADRADQSFISHFAMPGVERIFWYVNRNIPPYSPPNPSEENFGLTALDRTPLKAMASFQASGGALADFYLQKNYPTQSPTLRTLYYVPTTTGDGSLVTDYTSDGSVKTIPANSYMYFRVNDNWIYDSNYGLDTDVAVDVSFLDNGTGSYWLQYDGQAGAYTGQTKNRTNSGVWTTVTFLLNNVKFANRENNQSDLRLWASGGDFIVSRVVMRKQMNKASVVLGTNQRGRLMEQNIDDNSANAGYAPIVTQGGESCRKIEANNRRIYLRMCDGVAKTGDTDVTFGLRFWDSGTDNIAIHYNSVTNADAKVTIQKTNTNAWRYAQVSVNDAVLDNGATPAPLNYYFRDFAIGNDGTGVEYISKVDLIQRRATATLGGIDRFRLINHPLDPTPANLGYAVATTMGGQECYQIPGNNKYMFFQVSEAFANTSTPNITFGIRYWDGGTDTLQLRYNAVGNPNKGINITKTNTNTWKYVKLSVTDAAFSSSQSYYGDFCIGNYGDGSSEYISGVDVMVTPAPGTLL